MKSEDLWSLLGEFLLDNFEIFLVVMLLWIWGTEWLHEITVGKEIFLDKFLQVGNVGSSVPSISDMTTIHNLTEDVLQIGVWHNLEFLEIIGQHICALIEITLVELVGDRETLSTEFSSTKNQGMVEAQGKEKSFELIRLTARVDSLLIEVRVSSVQIILE